VEHDGVPQVLSTDIPQDAYLLDVREDDEWAAGHAPGAVHIRLGELSGRVEEVPSGKDVYVVCRSGARSNYAAQGLSASGRRAINVSDGMTGWAVAGLEIVSETGNDPFIA
jgi:rhodanese-related sulfurtransferase